MFCDNEFCKIFNIENKSTFKILWYSYYNNIQYICCCTYGHQKMYELFKLICYKCLYVNNSFNLLLCMYIVIYYNNNIT